MSLRITEIYPCILGESTLAGLPCTLVRLTGCPLRCRYCDTEYAFHGGEVLEVADIVARVQKEGLPLVLVTGGEPLIQKDAPALVGALLDAGFGVQVETSGAVDTSCLPEGTHVVLDLKCPDSGESHRMDWNNIAALRSRTDGSTRGDVKFVVSSRSDYEWSRDVIREHGLEDCANVLFSPAFGVVDPQDLAAWILEDRLRARLHLQIHKLVWEPDARGV